MAANEDQSDHHWLPPLLAERLPFQELIEADNREVDWTLKFGGLVRCLVNDAGSLAHLRVECSCSPRRH